MCWKHGEAEFCSYILLLSVLKESDVDHVRANEECDCPVPCKNTIYSLQTTTTALSKEWAIRKAQTEGTKFNYSSTDYL